MCWELTGIKRQIISHPIVIQMFSNRDRNREADWKNKGFYIWLLHHLDILITASEWDMLLFQIHLKVLSDGNTKVANASLACTSTSVINIDQSLF